MPPHRLLARLTIAVAEPDQRRAERSYGAAVVRRCHAGCAQSCKGKEKAGACERQALIVLFRAQQ